MKKIGIATLHFSDNYGAVLQAWALRTIINNIPGCNAEIINYIPEHFGYFPYDYTMESILSLQLKRAKFEEFLINNCGINRSIIRKISDEEWDYIVVGSDQVWNLSFRMLRDCEYLLPNISKKTKKISYAASIGMSAERANDYYEVFNKYLPLFEMISVREKEHIEFVERVSGNKCECVVDPTLLLMKDDYEKLIKNKKPAKKKYVLLFWLHKFEINSGIEFANSIARKYGLSIIHSFSEERPYMFWNSDGTMIYGGVGDFLWYIKNAEFVVTNSYHAVLFSMQFEIPMYIFPIPSMKSRITELRDTYGLEGRVVEGFISCSEISKDIDFRAIREKINIRRKESIKFLENALDVKR